MSRRAGPSARTGRVPGRKPAPATKAGGGPGPGGGRPELGRLPGFAVLHARVRWQFSERWQAYLRVHNVFDRRYASYAAGNLDLFPGGRALQPGADPGVGRFVAPGAPRLLMAGLRYEWDL